MSTSPSGPLLRVLTRNLYLGADLLGLADARSPVELAAAADAVRATVAATAFPVRARLLAAEVLASGADVVGVQEAALWRAGPVDAPAEAVTADHLALVLDALSDLGHPFDVASVQDAADAAVPTGSGSVRLTMRDAVLVRRGAGTEVLGRAGGVYGARLELPLLGRARAFDRGWAAADLATPVGRLRVVATHLDSVDPGVAAAQAAELLESLPPGPLVVLLDANSGPPPADPSAWELLRGSGLTDAWDAVHPDEAGPTCGLSETVDDPDWAALSTRIDHVLVRGPQVVDVERTGTQRRDEATGLWASDHTGVLATLRAGGRAEPPGTLGR